MAYRPRGMRTAGSTSSISLRRKGRHDPISALSGFLQCGRGHLIRLVRKKSFLVYPPADRSSSSTFPEGPVNTFPLSISCLFGAWAIIINPEDRGPSPGTTILRKDEMEHKWHLSTFLYSSSSFASVSFNSAPLLPCKRFASRDNYKPLPRNICPPRFTCPRIKQGSALSVLELSEKDPEHIESAGVPDITQIIPWFYY